MGKAAAKAAAKRHECRVSWSTQSTMCEVQAAHFCLRHRFCPAYVQVNVQACPTFKRTSHHFASPSSLFQYN